MKLNFFNCINAKCVYLSSKAFKFSIDNAFMAPLFLQNVMQLKGLFQGSQLQNNKNSDLNYENRLTFTSAIILRAFCSFC